MEAALARAEAKLGIIKQEHADEITRKARVELLDMEEMKRQLKHTFHPIMPLIRCLEKVCQSPAGEFIHWGATTQDIMDSGTVLQLKEANALIVRELATTHDLLSDIAQRHKNTVQAGRTHGQHALPITFGYKVAVWAAEIQRHLKRIEEMSPRVFRGQFGGAVGTIWHRSGDSGSSAGVDVRRPGAGGSGDRMAYVARYDGGVVSVYAMIGSTLGKIVRKMKLLFSSGPNSPKLKNLFTWAR